MITSGIALTCGTCGKIGLDVRRIIEYDLCPKCYFYFIDQRIAVRKAIEKLGEEIVRVNNLPFTKYRGARGKRHTRENQSYLAGLLFIYDDLQELCEMKDARNRLFISDAEV